MAKPSEGLAVNAETARLLDLGWEDEPDEDDVIEIYGDDETDGVLDTKGWDLTVDGTTVTSTAQLEEWLRRDRTSVEAFKRLEVYLTNVEREGFGWLRAL